MEENIISVDMKHVNQKIIETIQSSGIIQIKTNQKKFN